MNSDPWTSLIIIYQREQPVELLGEPEVNPECSGIAQVHNPCARPLPACQRSLGASLGESSQGEGLPLIPKA